MFLIMVWWFHFWYFWVLLFVNPVSSQPPGFYQILAIILSGYLYTRSFCHMFPSHKLIQKKSFVSSTSDYWFGLMLFYHLSDRIFFHHFGMSCYACIAWFCPGILWASLLSPNSFVYFFQLYCHSWLLFYFQSFLSIILLRIFPSSVLLFLVSLLIILTIFHPAFVFLIGFFYNFIWCCL